jgi:hypothetical protein
MRGCAARTGRRKNIEVLNMKFLAKMQKIEGEWMTELPKEFIEKEHIQDGDLIKISLRKKS